MSNAIESYAIIHNNPFILTPLFEVFYDSVPRKPKNILLSYLVLPLVLYPASRKFLANANARSSIRTMSKEHERFYGFPDRVEEYKALTNLCIQHAIDVGTLKIEEDLSLRVLGNRLDTSLCPITSAKAAKKLGNLFTPYEIPAIYRSLGVKKL
jgi:hypothetical protein